MADAKVLVGIGIGFLTGILFLLYKFLSSGQKEEEVTDVDAATQNPTEPGNHGFSSFFRSLIFFSTHNGEEEELRSSFDVAIGNFC